MRSILILAPLALLAGCGGEKPADPAVEAEATPAAAEATPAALPAVVANAKTAVKWAGTYAGKDAAGAALKLTLNADDTYEWVAGTAAPVKGKFNWYKDGARLLLDDAGGKAVYAVADGAIYKLAGPDAPITGPFTADQALTRAAQ